MGSVLGATSSTQPPLFPGGPSSALGATSSTQPPVFPGGPSSALGATSSTQPPVFPGGSSSVLGATSSTQPPVFTGGPSSALGATSSTQPPVFTGGSSSAYGLNILESYLFSDSMISKILLTLVIMNHVMLLPCCISKQSLLIKHGMSIVRHVIEHSGSVSPEIMSISVIILGQFISSIPFDTSAKKE